METWWTVNSLQCDGLTSLHHSFNKTLPAFLLQLNWQGKFNLASWRNFKAILIGSLPGLLLTIVDGHDRWKYNRVSRISQLSPLTCETETGLLPNVFEDFYR